MEEAMNEANGQLLYNGERDANAANSVGDPFGFPLVLPDRPVRLSQPEVVEDVFDGHRDLPQQFDDRTPDQHGHGFVECYLRGEISIHIDLRLWGESPQPSNLCAVINNAVLVDVPCESTANRSGADSDRTGEGEDIHERPVFVGVVHLVQLPETSEVRAVPSLIRLNPLDHPPVLHEQWLNVWRRPTEMVTPTLAASLATWPVLEDREAGSVAGFSAITREFTDGLVESGTEVVCNLADNRAPLDYGRLFFALYGVSPEDVCTGLRIELSGTDTIGVTLNPMLEGRFECLDVSFGTRQLDTWADECLSILGLVGVGSGENKECGHHSAVRGGL